MLRCQVWWNVGIPCRQGQAAISYNQRVRKRLHISDWCKLLGQVWWRHGLPLQPRPSTGPPWTGCAACSCSCQRARRSASPVRPCSPDTAFSPLYVSQSLLARECVEVHCAAKSGAWELSRRACSTTGMLCDPATSRSPRHTLGWQQTRLVLR